jgi:predicted O-methyltransferase YrrM
MEIKEGYYRYNPKNNTEHVVANEILKHDPQSEKILFTLAIVDLYYELEKKNTQRVQGVEIGVLNGETSRHLLNIGNFVHLVGIDPLIPDSMEPSLIGSASEIFKNIGDSANRWWFIHDYSENVHDRFELTSIDFLFIDGDHTYDAVKRDFENYFPKVKHGGLIFFHDSRMNRGGAQFHVGSSRFVDELILKNQHRDDLVNVNEHGLELIGEAFSLTCFKKH